MIYELDLHSYDKYIISFSGGKDSTSCLLYLLDQGVPKQKIELWHQDIDGRDKQFFDWEVTPDYCRRFAEAFGIKIYYQWREGGFRRELFRENSRTAPTHFEQEDGTIGQAGGIKGSLGTRLRFPQQSGDLSVRWCSASLKIDVCSIAIRNQERFRGIRTLLISGERGEESPQRAKYKTFEIDRADRRNGKSKRHVDHFRPLLHWKENRVWEIIERYRVRVHPCYYMGWGRCSCKLCIFGNRNQWASVYKISPEQVQEKINLEKQFNCTINRKSGLQALISKGVAYDTITEKLATLATSFDYTKPIFIPENETWILPSGAYGENCGAP